MGRDEGLRAVVVLVGQVPARGREMITRALGTGVKEETEERSAMVPILKVQIALYRGAGPIFGWSLPWDQRY